MNFQQEIELKIRMNKSKIVRLFQEEKNVCGGFGGEEIKDC